MDRAEIDSYLTKEMSCVCGDCEEKPAGVVAYMPRFNGRTSMLMTVAHCKSPQHRVVAQNMVAQVAKLVHMQATGDHTVAISPN